MAALDDPLTQHSQSPSSIGSSILSEPADTLPFALSYTVQSIDLDTDKSHTSSYSYQPGPFKRPRSHAKFEFTDPAVKEADLHPVSLRVRTLDGHPYPANTIRVDLDLEVFLEIQDAWDFHGFTDRSFFDFYAEAAVCCRTHFCLEADYKAQKHWMAKAMLYQCDLDTELAEMEGLEGLLPQHAFDRKRKMGEEHLKRIADSKEEEKTLNMALSGVILDGWNLAEEAERVVDAYKRGKRLEPDAVPVSSEWWDKARPLIRFDGLALRYL